MWNTFKYTLLFLMRERNVLIWALAFPLVLATVFNFMFANLDEASRFSAVPVAVVADKSYEDEVAFGEVITSVSKPGDDQLLNTRYVSTEDEASQLLEEKSIEGYITISSEGEPSYHVGVLTSATSSEGVNRTIVKTFLDTYVQNVALLTEVIQENPQLLLAAESPENLVARHSYTNEVSVTANDPSGTVRYFYALLGFAAIMAATIGLTSISATLANTSALGARRNLGGTSKSTTLLATLAASWLAAFVCLIIAYGFIRVVFGINFGNNDVACIFGLFVASLVSTALGSAIGAIPRLSEGLKAGIMTGLSCFLSLFAGLYGQAAMALADEVARTAPILQSINPARQISELFYSLYYYETYTQYFQIIGILLVTAIVLFAVASLLMRRQRYASL